LKREFIQEILQSPILIYSKKFACDSRGITLTEILSENRFKNITVIFDGESIFYGFLIENKICNHIFIE
jgi:hypothetical protein